MTNPAMNAAKLFNPANARVSVNRLVPQTPVQELTVWPRWAYHQKNHLHKPRLVKDEAEAAALGPDWGPFPYDPTPKPDRSLIIEEEQAPPPSAGSEYPKYVYHQTSAQAQPRLVKDPDEEAKFAEAGFGPKPMESALPPVQPEPSPEPPGQVDGLEPGVEVPLPPFVPLAETQAPALAEPSSEPAATEAEKPVKKNGNGKKAA